MEERNQAYVYEGGITDVGMRLDVASDNFVEGDNSQNITKKAESKNKN